MRLEEEDEHFSNRDVANQSVNEGHEEELLSYLDDIGREDGALILYEMPNFCEKRKGVWFLQLNPILYDTPGQAARALQDFRTRSYPGDDVFGRPESTCSLTGPGEDAFAQMQAGKRGDEEVRVRGAEVYFLRANAVVHISVYGAESSLSDSALQGMALDYAEQVDNYIVSKGY